MIFSEHIQRGGEKSLRPPPKIRPWHTYILSAPSPGGQLYPQHGNTEKIIFLWIFCLPLKNIDLQLQIEKYCFLLQNSQKRLQNFGEKKKKKWRNCLTLRNKKKNLISRPCGLPTIPGTCTRPQCSKCVFGVNGV